jgi:protein tyrosine phosphatase (PTP) superfamily phosphohydrolase (DUF442 family)
MAKPITTLLLAGLLSVGCTAGEPTIAPEDVEGPFVWGAAAHVTRLGNLWFADQPDAAGLDAARQNGVGVVVNLREPEELTWDEASAVEAMGMHYFSVPVSGALPFSAQAFDRIEEIVASHPNQQVLIHCSSSNRAAGWLATHLVQREGMAVEDALAVGRRTGITKDAIAEKVRAYLSAAADS